MLRVNSLENLLRPTSVVVIGASESPGNLGGVALKYYEKFGYKGQVWVLNPKVSEVFGFKSFSTISDLPQVPDIAIFATGADLLLELLPEVADFGVRSGIAWAAGFSEIGELGIARQAELVNICKDFKFNLVGPNSIGIVDSANKNTATFASFLGSTDDLKLGNISMVSQSGGIGTQAYALAQKMGFGFRSLVSTGNEAILTTSDFISAFSADPGTKIIAVYIEGVQDGDQFIDSLRSAQAAGKPVVVLKGGKSESSARAAKAHTGALIGGDDSFRSVLKDFGVAEVYSLEELLDVLFLLASSNERIFTNGPRLGIVTFGGGGGVLAADQAIKCGLKVIELQQSTKNSLAKLVPSIASISNPIDLTPQTYNDPKYREKFYEVLSLISKDPNIDVLLAYFGPMGQGIQEILSSFTRVREESLKPIVLLWPLAPIGVYSQLEKLGIYAFEESERAIRAISKLWLAQSNCGHIIEQSNFEFDWAKQIPHVFDGLILLEDKCSFILSEAGIQTAPGKTLRDLADLNEYAEICEFPVVLKVISPDVLHRASSGLVKLDIRSIPDLHSSYEDLLNRAKEIGAKVEGIFVQKMMNEGVEILVSGYRDPIFGPMVSVGAGGVLTEILNDVTVSRAPVDTSGASALLKSLKLFARLDYGAKGLQIETIAEFVSKFSLLVASIPWNEFIFEVNPVKWTQDGATAIDGLLIIEGA